RQSTGLRGQRRRPRFLRERPDRFVAASGRHPGEASAVAAELQPLLLHDRRPCRRARYPRIQHCAGRSACPMGADLPCVTRDRSLENADDLLRQGTPRRGLQRHLLLVSEPPRGYGTERQFVTHLFFARVSPAPSGAGIVLALSRVCYCRSIKPSAKAACLFGRGVYTISTVRRVVFAS